MVQQIHSDVVFLEESLCFAPGSTFCSAIRELSPSSRIVLVGRRAPEPDQLQDRVWAAAVDAVLLRPLHTDEVLSLLARLKAGRAVEQT
jgi:hypothetical protein